MLELLAVRRTCVEDDSRASYLDSPLEQIIEVESNAVINETYCMATSWAFHPSSSDSSLGIAVLHTSILHLEPSLVADVGSHQFYAVFLQRDAFRARALSRQRQLHPRVYVRVHAR